MLTQKNLKVPDTNKPITLVVAVVLTATLVLTPKTGINKQRNYQHFRQRVSLSPKSYNSPDFTDFFEKAKQAGTIVSWAGDWNDLNTQNSAALVVVSLASTYGYVPVIEPHFFNQSSGTLLRPLDNATTQAYRNLVVAFVEKYKPRYLALGAR
jgi:hypothetical protein